MVRVIPLCELLEDLRALMHLGAAVVGSEAAGHYSATWRGSLVLQSLETPSGMWVTRYRLCDGIDWSDA